jgi:hypothetical protein
MSVIPAGRLRQENRELELHNKTLLRGGIRRGVGEINEMHSRVRCITAQCCVAFRQSHHKSNSN